MCKLRRGMIVELGKCSDDPPMILDILRHEDIDVYRRADVTMQPAGSRTYNDIPGSMFI